MLMRANMINTQNPMALMRYGTISLIVPPAREKATVASATPLARLARGKISVGYTQLLLLATFTKAKRNKPSREPGTTV